MRTLIYETLKSYTKKYLTYFGYTTADFIPCEVCGARSVDVHHIEPKGMGGSKTKDFIGNLIALDRDCHNKAHANEITKDQLKKIHNEQLGNITENL